MTRYLCAPDSFKESLTAMEAARAMAQGIENADHGLRVKKCVRNRGFSRIDL